jgi:hypothetical protein
VSNRELAAELRALADKIDPPAMPAKISVRVLARAMARMEGADDPRSVNQRLVREHRRWNQGHLIWANQRGAVGIAVGDRAWAAWPSEEEGWQGLMRQIRLDASRGMTLEAFIGKYAPRFENNTGRYIASVSAWTGIEPGTALSAALDFAEVV